MSDAVKALFSDESFQDEAEATVDTDEGFEPDTEIVDETVDIAPEPEPEPEPIIETVAEPEQEDREARHIPIGAMLDERDKRKKAEEEREALRRQLDELQKAQAAPAHDLYSDDPYFDQFRREEEAKFERRMFEHRLADSDERAREKHGQEVVMEAAMWAKNRMETDKTFEGQFLASRRPMEFLVEQHKRDRQISDMMTDPDAWALRRAAEIAAASAPHGSSAVSPAPAAAPTNKPASPVPPKSITSLTNHGHGSDQPSGQLSAVNSLFQ